MNGDLIATTSSEGLKPLGSQAQRSFELVQSEIAARLGDDHATLFAEPIGTDYGDQTDWYATRIGRVSRLGDLDDDIAATVLDRLAVLVGDIREVAGSLSASDESGDQRLGEALANAVEIPDETAIHAIEDGGIWHPILINWARASDVQRTVRGVLTGASRQGAGAVAGRVGSDASPRADGQTPSGAVPSKSADTATATGVLGAMSGWLMGLGWLTLAILCAWIVALMLEPCGLNLSFSPSACPEEVSQAEPDPAVAESAVLRNRIMQLERQIAIADRVCQPVFEDRTDLVPPAAPQPGPPVMPTTVPTVLPASPQTSPDVVSPCPPGQVARETGELVLLVDASGSMEIGADIPPDMARDYYQLMARLEEATQSGRRNLLNFEESAYLGRLEGELRDLPGPTRMDITRDVLGDTVDQAPPGIDISMVVFPNCNDVQDAGTFATAQRGDLKRAIGSLRPVGKTALADAVRLAMGKVRGGQSVDEPANILLVSDGIDSCDGDPCAAAQSVKLARPGIAINIVDLGQSTSLECIARATGGYYIQSGRGDRAELGRIMREAAGYEGRGLCRTGTN